MLKSLSLLSMLFFVPLAAAQVNTPAATAEGNARMLMPPPISGIDFPIVVGAQERSNYLRGGIVFSGGHINNLYPGSGTTTLDETTFRLEPDLALDRTTSRGHMTLRYAPAFDFYQPDSSLDTVNHTGSALFQYRLTPHVTVLAGDRVTKTTNVLYQPLSAVSGGLPSATPGFVAPFAEQISNRAYGRLAWQYGPNSMIGLGGDGTVLHFPNPKQAQGLYNSLSRSGEAFYTHRLAGGQYVGGLYQYSLITATPAASGTGIAEADLEANDVMGFYTVYPRPRLSISLGAGSQHYKLTQAPSAPHNAWAPIAVGSIGWQAPHASFALSYSRVVTGGEGIVGAYTSDSGNLSARWELSPAWTAGVAGNYSQLKPVSKTLVGSTPGGHTLSFSGTLERRLGQNLSLSAEYQRLHQTYNTIPSIAVNPESSRVTASISYQFSRLLGR